MQRKWHSGVFEMDESLVSALCWDGVYARIQAYAVFDVTQPQRLNVGELDLEGAMQVKRATITWLEDERGIVRDAKLCVIDFVLDGGLPLDLAGYLSRLMNAISSLGAKRAWLQLEGGFDFDLLMADEVASEIYGLLEGGEVRLALEEGARVSEVWLRAVRAFRDRVLTS